MDNTVNLRKLSEEELEQFYDIFEGEIESKPETEKVLFDLQAKYLTSRDPRYWNSMLKELFPYLRSCLLKRNKHHKYIPEEDVDIISLKASVNFLSRYLRDEKFIVGASFAGMFKWAIIHELHDKRIDPNDYVGSLNTVINTDGNSQELLELSDALGMRSACGPARWSTPEDELIPQSAYDIICEVLDELRETKCSEKTISIVSLYVVLFLRKPKIYHSKDTFLSVWAPDYETRTICERTVLEIKNRLRAESMRG